jgi:hypothetical protein
MDLEHLAAGIRPRTPWEAIDLGFALARAWFLPLWACWWLTAAPVALLALLPLQRHADAWLLLLWWLKPAFEALPLYWLSRAMFGERLSLRVTLRRLPAALPPRLWPQLLWRRIGLTRSFSMPVTLLEAPRGAARRARLRVLRDGAAAWLTVLCAHLEAVLWLSALLALVFLLPEGTLGPTLPLQGGAAMHWLVSLLVLLAVSVMAPFYVAAGFALYIGRRTSLEAWDLELAFRRAAARARAGVPAWLLALSAAAPLWLLAPTPLQASQPAPDAETVRLLIEEVLADPDFGSTREARVWVYVGDARDGAPGEALTWLPGPLIQAIATLLKWLMLITGVVLLVLLVLHLLREFPATGRRRRRAKANAAGQAPAADATPTPLPLNIPAEVQRLLAGGDARGALALLYRAQIARLRGAGLELPDSATEAECLAAAARGASAAQLDRLGRLLALWQGVAYGHRPADARAVQALLSDHAAAAGAPLRHD